MSTKIYVNDQLHALRLDEAYATMSAQRRDYLLQFRNDASRRAGAAAYMLLSQGLRELFGISQLPTFAFGPHGKPFLPDHPHIHFSLSHCDEAAVCAIGPEPVGIDVESTSAYSPDLLPHTMSADESAAVLSAEHPERVFTQLWTRKEAYLKLIGTGITDQLPHVLAEAHDSGCLFQTAESSNGSFIYSVCLFNKAESGLTDAR